jgi:putative ABC transport system permease protein
MVAGRTFTAADTAQSPLVVIVNQTLARRFWPQGGAVGGRLVVANGRTLEIVGIAGDVKQDRVEGEEWPTIYGPFRQMPYLTMTMVLRTAGSPLSVKSAVEREVHQLDPDQPVTDVRPMESVVDRAIAGARFNTVLLGIFAVIAFLLAAVGIYGVIAFDVSERTHEIGIRMALGAQSNDVLKLIVGHGARLAACGIAVGLAGAFALTRLMATMLYSVKATDAFTFALISLLLGAVALGASYLPSRRAMALNPLAALRHE